MSTQFTIHRKGADHPERPRRRAAFLLRERMLVSKAHGPFMIERDDNGDLGPDRTEFGVNRIVSKWSRSAKPGARLDVHSQDDVFAFKAIEVAPPVQAPAIAPALQPFYERAFEKWGYATNLGNWYCRYISGTRTVSRHGYYQGTSWRGAAQDFGADTGAELEVMAKAFVSWTTDSSDTQCYGKLSTVIYHDQIWTPGGWHRYTGVYHYHVHIDVPQGYACNP